MKKNEERILNYLSGRSDGTERTSFESELASSDELKKEFEAVTSRLRKINLSDYPQTDERYFAALIPRVKERLEKERKLFNRKSVYYAAPAAAAVLIISLLLFNPKSEFENQYKELADAVADNFTDTAVSARYFAELESRPAEEIFTGTDEEISASFPAGLEVENDSYTRLIDNPIAHEYGTLNRLSDQELEIIYDKLNLISSQKVAK